MRKITIARAIARCIALASSDMIDSNLPEPHSFVLPASKVARAVSTAFLFNNGRACKVEIVPRQLDSLLLPKNPSRNDRSRKGPAQRPLAKPSLDLP